MIDFLEPNPVEKLFRVFRHGLGERGRSMRLTMVVGALVLTAFALEALRVHAAWQASTRWEVQRDRWTTTLTELEKKMRIQAAERSTVLALVELRSESVLQAIRIAKLGNAIAPRVGLVSLRRVQDGVEIEGRAQSIDDVATTVARVEQLERARETTFALKRENSVSGYVWFRLGLRK